MVDNSSPSTFLRATHHITTSSTCSWRGKPTTTSIKSMQQIGQVCVFIILVMHLCLLCHLNNSIWTMSFLRVPGATANILSTCKLLHGINVLIELHPYDIFFCKGLEHEAPREPIPAGRWHGSLDEINAHIMKQELSNDKVSLICSIVA
jgi:hypothetical protein